MSSGTRDPTPDPIRREHHRPVYRCGGCGADVTGNHRVKDGEAFCTDCEPLSVGRGLPDPDFEPPQSIEEYDRRRGVLLDVGDLLADGVQVR